MKVKKILILLIVICSVLIVACSEPNEIATNPVREPAPVLTADVVKMDFVEEFLSIGTFKAKDIVKVYTGGEGVIERIMVSPGEKVVTGEVLFTLDKSDYENNYKAIESQLRTVRDSARIEYNQALKAFENDSILYESGAVSKEELDASSIRLKKGKQSYQDAVTNYSSQVATLKEALDNRMVTAPIDGVIGAVYVEEKETVSNSIAVEIVNAEQMFVNAMVTDKVLAYISKGDSVLIHPDGEYGETLRGVVENYNIVADERNGLYDVEVLVIDPALASRTGSYAELTFMIKERNSYAVLRKGVIKRGEEEYVYVVEEDTAIKKKVVTGVTNQQYVEIISGLNGGEVLVIQGQESLDDGSPVIIQSHNK